MKTLHAAPRNIFRRLVALLAPGWIALSLPASEVEYSFHAPEGPLIWDFSAPYPEPLSLSLWQNSKGELTASDGSIWYLTRTPGTGALALYSNTDYHGGYWRYINSYTTDYVLYTSRETRLVLDPITRSLNGDESFTTWSQRYVMFLFSWAAYRDLTTNITSTPLSVPLPAEVNGSWKLDLNDAVTGDDVSGTATVALTGTNRIVLLVSGTNATLTKSVLKLRSDDGANDLDLVTLGPDKALQSMHGRIAGQQVDYTAPTGPSPLALAIHGDGVVTPIRDGEALVTGKDYRMTARPGKGSLFASWEVGGVVVTNATLRFTMAPHLAISANFISNFFIPSRGEYAGLFYDTNGAWQQCAGQICATLAANGGFSGRLSFAEARYAFSGRFNSEGRARIVIRRDARASIVLQLLLDPGQGEISGTVGVGSAEAQVFAPRALRSSAEVARPLRPAYTLVIPGHTSTSNALGDGYARLRVTSGGMVCAAGKLADGTPLTSAARISQDGQWPFWTPLYRGAGSILGWITFGASNAQSLEGEVLWFKPVDYRVEFYPSGFTLEIAILGSAFEDFDWSGNRGGPGTGDAVLTLTGGDLPAPMVLALPTTSSDLSLSLDSKTGEVRGTFTHPVTGQQTQLLGVVVKSLNQARGFFLGTHESGSFVLQL